MNYNIIGDVFTIVLAIIIAIKSKGIASWIMNIRLKHYGYRITEKETKTTRIWVIIAGCVLFILGVLSFHYHILKLL